MSRKNGTEGGPDTVIDKRIEYELKYVVPVSVDLLEQQLGKPLTSFSYDEIEQGYLTVPGQPGNSEERVRKLTTYTPGISQPQVSYVFTKKEPIENSSGSKRTEIEYPITAEVFKEYWQKTTEQLRKKRFRIPVDIKIQGSPATKEYHQLVAELDVYEEALKGLITVELEMPEALAVNIDTWVLPQWFGKDVTDDYHFKNKNLATVSTNPEQVQVFLTYVRTLLGACFQKPADGSHS